MQLVTPKFYPLFFECKKNLDFFFFWKNLKEEAPEDLQVLDEATLFFFSHKMKGNLAKLFGVLAEPLGSSW